ncbi:hypothetical protein DSO57_1004965 [Entomophthora muscae]|uniref:Uncharacterized protein n=1 Tax=Entomophthora muscae TaxID=34485 RepID=A0ACC2U6W5_9FUNG|nr:hypothetical protein DSO57_1004965 [Entomophthora muscae]
MNGANHSGTRVSFKQTTFQPQAAIPKTTNTVPNERHSNTIFIHSIKPGVHPRSKQSFKAYSLNDNISLMKLLLKENPFAAPFGSKLQSWTRLSDSILQMGHRTNPKKCREYLTKFLEEQEKSEWFQKRTAGSKPDLSELEVLVEKAILQKRAGANKSQRPDGSSPHILNGSKSQAISIQSCPTIQVTDNVSDLIFHQ